MVAWESTLPQSPLINGYQEVEADTALRTNMDAGPAQVRQRFQAGVKQVVYPVHLTTAQRATLTTFYRTTLKGGTLPFTHVLPEQTVHDNIRFTATPRYTPVSHNLWRSDLQWEVLPK